MGTVKRSYREVQRFYQSVIHNFEVSVMMPFCHKLETFRKVLPKNAPYLQRNGIEVIIVMDGASEQEGLIDLIKHYPFINWKVLVIEEKHTPHSHAQVLNVGIRHATKKYIFVSDPETEFYTDAILQLRELLEKYPGHYATGTIAFLENRTQVSIENQPLQNWMKYGSIMVEKRALEAIGGYDEYFNVWGGEDNNILRRLDMAGVKQLKVPEAKSLYRAEKLILKERFAKISCFSTKEWQAFFYPKTAKANNGSWSKAFEKLVYDWQNNQYAEELCYNYLNSFLQFEVKGGFVFKTKYKKLILCQAYNENEFLPGFLEDITKYFDGVILLDDESTDNTWHLVQHDKVLLKVKKKRGCFNDLQNRNILLNLASFFQTEWFCFMDIDERFDERYVDFEAFENNKNKSVIAFKAVYLWNSKKTYYKNIPNSKQGILRIFRMFRPIGRMQISTHKCKFHFAQIPYLKNISHEKILFADYGIIKKSRRTKKYKRYKKEDLNNDLTNYEYLIDKEPDLLELSKIDI